MVQWKKGFGFIERDDKEKDAFVHASAVKAAGMRYLNEGDKLILAAFGAGLTWGAAYLTWAYN